MFVSFPRNPFFKGFLLVLCLSLFVNSVFFSVAEAAVTWEMLDALGNVSQSSIRHLVLVGEGYIPPTVPMSALPASLGSVAAAASSLTMTPYMLLAIMLVGGGVLAYKNWDELVAVAQWLKSKMMPGGGWFGSGVSSSYFDVTKLWNPSTSQFTLTDKAKQLLAELPSVLAEKGSLPYTAPPDVIRVHPSLTEVLTDLPSNVADYYLSFALPGSANIVYVYGFERAFPLDFSRTGTTTSYKILGDWSRHAITQFSGIVIYDMASSSVVSHVTPIDLEPSSHSTSIVEPLNIPDNPSVSLTVSRSGVGANIKYSYSLTGFSFDGVNSAASYYTGITISNGRFSTEYNAAPPVVRDVDISGTIISTSVVDAKRNLDSAFPLSNAVIDVNLDSVVTNNHLDTMVNTGTVNNSTSVTAPDIVIDAEMAGDISSGIDSFLSDTLVPEFLPNTFESFKALENVRFAPPVIRLNLASLFNASVSHFAPDINSPFEDAESVLIDFGMLNSFGFMGIPLIDYFRGIVGFGFVWTTFFFIKRKIYEGD